MHDVCYDDLAMCCKGNDNAEDAEHACSDACVSVLHVGPCNVTGLCDDDDFTHQYSINEKCWIICVATVVVNVE